MNRILEGIRVIDWTQWHAGPQAAAFLGDMGADVYHLEQKGVGDQFRGMVAAGGIPLQLPQGPHILFEGVNRNKRGLALDLQKPSSTEIINRLIKSSDVFLTNREADTITRFGLDYATLSQVNPQLIYVRATPFGDKGPDADMPAFDPTFQARSGLMFAIAQASEPRMGPAYIADEMLGMVLSQAILAALLARERYGIGQEVQCNGLASAMQLLYQLINIQLLSGKERSEESRKKPNVPTFNYYRCSDGAWLTIAAHRETDWAPLCHALGIPELETNPAYATMMKRISNRTDLVELLDSVFAKKTREEWIERLRREHIAYAPVNKITDLSLDPQVIENHLITGYDHPTLGEIKVMGFPWEFSKTPAVRSRPAPEHGQHNEEILMEVCGYTWDDIGRLQKEGAI